MDGLQTFETQAPLIKVTGHKGQTVRAYFDQSEGGAFAKPDDKTLPSMEITGDGSINTLCIDTDIVVVGAYADRSDRIQAANTVCMFSSWANLVGGGTLPDVVAPGYNIIAGFNHLYLDEEGNPSTDLRKDYFVTIDGAEQQYGVMSGTSMSSPYVCGVVALWLQANPNLTPAQVHEIIRNTSDKSVLSQTKLDPATYGHGLINAYDGLKYILNTMSIPTITFPEPLIKVVDRYIEITTAAGEPCRAQLFNAAGMLVASSNGDIDASGLASGVYVLRVNDRATRKIALR